ncbi:FxsA family protein [Pseudoneobacillus sp. C159]
MRLLLLLIIIIPAAEISFLLVSGRIIGTWPTIFLIIFTGVIGSYLAKKQGLSVYRQLQQQLQMGEMPGETILDGICILVGGIFLLAPGFLTDIMGFLLLFPVTRVYFKKFMKKKFHAKIHKNNRKIIY